MINRVLIRIKVVQLLYSYLLVENRFTLESPSSQPTREKRFAYSLYTDMLCLMAGIAEGIKRRNGEKPLYDTGFMRRVVADEKIKSLLHMYAGGSFPYEYAQQSLTEKVKESGLYKNFLKNEEQGALADGRIWQEIFNTIILPDPQLNKKFSEQEGYSLSGVERMKKMMENTFTNFYASADNLPDALNTLKLSMDKARELYFRLLDLPVQLTQLRERDIEEQRNKYLASSEERNPNMRFVENALVNLLFHNEELERNIDKYGRQMTIDDEPMLRSLLRDIMNSDLYKEYMEFPATDLQRDVMFWRDAFRNIILNNPAFLEALEDKSVFWNDDVDIVGTFVMKTFRRIAEAAEAQNSPAGHKDNHKSLTEEEAILPMFKDEEDARFGSQLFQAVVNNKETYREYIDAALDRSVWESERLAYMDVVVLSVALAEILNFPKIPLQVSLNEYVEIAKTYSTAKSGQFVNGLLSAILRHLKKEGKLLKSLPEKKD